MTVHTDLAAISLTQNAVNVGQAEGVNLPALIALAQDTAIQLQTQLKQIISLHPSTGGDAANYAALQAVLAELT